MLKQSHLALQKQSSSQAEEIAKLNDDNLQLKQDLNWLKRQLFGRKSEKRLLELGDSRQLSLGEILLPEKESAPEEGSTVKSYARGKKKPFKDAVNEEGLQLVWDLLWGVGFGRKKEEKIYYKTSTQVISEVNLSSSLLTVYLDLIERGFWIVLCAPVLHLPVFGKVD